MTTVSTNGPIFRGRHPKGQGRLTVLIVLPTGIERMSGFSAPGTVRSSGNIPARTASATPARKTSALVIDPADENGEQGGRYADHEDLHQIYVMRLEQADHGRSRHGRSTQSFTNVQTACAPCAARGGFGGEAAAGGTDRLKVL